MPPSLARCTAAGSTSFFNQTAASIVSLTAFCIMALSRPGDIHSLAYPTHPLASALSYSFILILPIGRAKHQENGLLSCFCSNIFCTLSLGSICT